jgi:hypothetical protein
MSCHTSHCHPSGLPQPNNECCDDVKEAARFAYANAQQAAASAANAATTLADVVQKSGDTMTGPLILSGDPVALLGAASKQYVDNAVAIGLTIPDGSITTPKLANLAVQTAKIDDFAVTTNKIANNAVDGTKIPDLTLTTNKIADNQITFAKLGTVEKTRVAQAWVNFDGTLASPIAPRAAFNVSSVTKNGTGDFTINFATALTDVNYTVSGTTNSSGPANAYGGVVIKSTNFASNPTLKSTTQVTILTAGIIGVANVNDCKDTYIQVLGN